MLPALPLLLALSLGAEARVEAGVRGEARGRHLAPASSPADADAVDLSAFPRLLLGIREGAAALEATYAPRFTVRDVGPDHRYDQMHEGELRLRLERPRQYRLEAFGGGAAGRTDLLTYTAGSGGTGAITTTSSVNLERLRAGLAATVQLDRRNELLGAVSATEEGGTDATSRGTLPVARTLDASAEYRWGATPLDQVGVRLAARGTRIASHRADSSIGEVMATWRHRADRQLEVWAGLGAVHLRSRLPDEADPARRRGRQETRPAAEAGFTRAATPPPPAAASGAEPAEGTEAQRPIEGLSGDGVIHLGADVDRLTGVASPQLDATTGLRWPVARGLALLLRGSGSLTWPDTGRTGRVQADLGLTKAFTEHFSIDAGVYGARQVSTTPGLPDFTELGAFLGVALNARPLTF